MQTFLGWLAKTGGSVDVRYAANQTPFPTAATLLQALVKLERSFPPSLSLFSFFQFLSTLLPKQNFRTDLGCGPERAESYDVCLAFQPLTDNILTVPSRGTSQIVPWA